MSETKAPVGSLSLTPEWEAWAVDNAGTDEPKAGHTPGPLLFYWRTNEAGEPDCGIFALRLPGHAYSIARCPRYQTKERWEADAARIVLTWEAHDDLVAALELVDAWGHGLRHETAHESKMVRAARAALAKARPV